MKKIVFLFILVVIMVGGPSSVFAKDGSCLDPDQPLKLAGKAAAFDFMEVDHSAHRILAAHSGAKTLELVDLANGTPLRAVVVGEAQGIAVDNQGHKYYVGNEADHNIVFVDSNSLLKTGQVVVEGPVDAMAFDPKNRRLYAAEHHGDRVWIVDVDNKKVLGTVTIPGVPEVIEYDSKTDKFYLNIKNRNIVVRIDPETQQVDATWSTLPAKSPHGLAVDSERGQLFSAGGNGQLVSIDLRTGNIRSSIPISNGTDQMAYDSGNKNIYCAAKSFISVVDASGEGLKLIEDKPSPQGAHTLAVDPISHDVWISYSDQKHSYLQRYKVTAATAVKAGPKVQNPTHVAPEDRISLDEARKRAFRIYGGQVISETLKLEGPRWVYVFDLRSHSDKEVHQIQIDALTGEQVARRPDL